MKTVAIVLSLWLIAPMAGGAETAKKKQQVHVTSTTEKAAAPRPQPLTEDEQQQLAQRNEEPGKEIAGGALSNQNLTYIVIALATAVIVLIAVQ